jgi:hypothetical protein
MPIKFFPFSNTKPETLEKLEQDYAEFEDKVYADEGKITKTYTQITSMPSTDHYFNGLLWVTYTD